LICFCPLGELALREQEKKPGFSLLLLHLTATTTYPYNTRLASALFFKNFIKRNWTDEDGNYKLPQNEVATIKQELISLMISMPPAIQSQLGEAVSVIADSDFWERWDTLVDVGFLRFRRPEVHIANCSDLRLGPGLAAVCR
jgi:exportin-2 (importin alpha re-exporter)